MILGRAGLSLMSASAGLDRLERRVARSGRLRERLRATARAFDAVVVDTPPSRTERLHATLRAADGVVCPVELETYAIDSIAAMLHLTADVQRRANPALEFLGVVVNRVNAKAGARQPGRARLLASFGSHVLSPCIGARAAIADALDTGVEPSSRARRLPLPVRTALDEVFAQLQARLAESRMCRPSASEACDG